MQAVILAGGLGSRLRPLTADVPKPMVRVAGVPYLQYQLERLASQEITDVIILTGYLGQQIEDYFGAGTQYGLHIRYSREPAPLGTGGALRLAEELLAERFLVIYGDSYLPIDYRPVLERLRSFTASGAGGVLVVYEDADGRTFVTNNVGIGSSGEIIRYEKRSEGERALSPPLTRVEAGVLALSRSVVGMIPPGRAVSLEQELFPQLIERHALVAFEVSQRFYDIGTAARLAQFEEYIRHDHDTHTVPD